jgi:hypothetical protein
MMFCPKCYVDYPQGTTGCSQCGVRLVARHQPESAGGNSRAALAWYGDDPAAFSAVLAALQDADIQTHEISAHYHLLREPGTFGPLQGIYVHAEDLTAARKVIAEVLGRNDGGIN